MESPHTAVEALISINNQLRQPEAAVGILVMAQQQLHMELKVRNAHNLYIICFIRTSCVSRELLLAFWLWHSSSCTWRSRLTPCL